MRKILMTPLMPQSQVKYFYFIFLMINKFKIQEKELENGELGK